MTLTYPTGFRKLIEHNKFRLEMCHMEHAIRLPVINVTYLIFVPENDQRSRRVVLKCTYRFKIKKKNLHGRRSENRGLGGPEKSRRRVVLLQGGLRRPLRDGRRRRGPHGPLPGRDRHARGADRAGERRQLPQVRGGRPGLPPELPLRPPEAPGVPVGLRGSVFFNQTLHMYMYRHSRFNSIQYLVPSN